MEITAHFAASAIETVRQVAATEILPRFRFVAAHIKDDGSVVTEADYAAQAALETGLRRVRDAPVMGEEMRAAEQRAILETAPCFWCVDPLDGTRNFSEAIARFAVSVALIENGRPVFGVIYDPIADEAFHAIRGVGAWLNAGLLRLSDRGPALREAIAEVSVRRDLAPLRAPLKQRKPYRRRETGGSAALGWCHLAAARTDVMLSSAQKMWDYAAGALILQEAGGHLSGIHQDDYWSGAPWSRAVIAARTPQLLEEWRAWIRRELAAAA